MMTLYNTAFVSFEGLGAVSAWGSVVSCLTSSV